MKLQHPFPLGTCILSIAGECDSEIVNGQDRDRSTGPNAVGIVASVDDYSGNGQGWAYGVEFAPSGVYVTIDQADSIDDPTQYHAFNALELLAQNDALRGMLLDLRAAADAIDDRIDDREHDGANAVPPDGDTYNDLLAQIPTREQIEAVAGPREYENANTALARTDPLLRRAAVREAFDTRYTRAATAYGARFTEEAPFPPEPGCIVPAWVCTVPSGDNASGTTKEAAAEIICKRYSLLNER